MGNKIFTASAAVVIANFSSISAYAQDGVPEAPIYIRGSVSAARVSLPKTEFLLDRIRGTQLEGERGTDSYGLDGAVGFQVPALDGALGLLGRNTRVEITGGRTYAKSTQLDVLPTTTAGSIVFIDGTTPVSQFAAGSWRVNYKVSQEKAAVLLKSDHDVGPGQSLAFYAGPSYRRIVERFDVYQRAGLPNYQWLRDRLSAGQYGTVLGADLDKDLGQGFSFIAGGELGLHYTSAHLEANQDPNRANGGGATRSLKDREDGITADFQMRSGFAYRYGALTASLVGFVDFTPNMPAIENATPGRAAHVSWKETHALGGRLGLSIGF